MNTAFGVEVVYIFDSESDGGVFFWTLEEAKAYFEEMKTSVPKDNLQYAVDYMVLYKVEGDKSTLTSFCFADVVEGEECIEGWEWEDEDWPEENKSTDTN
ncbi:hypothetical protein N8478_00805 [bacterium]|nr:hypothetical protein [bacterium]